MYLYDHLEVEFYHYISVSNEVYYYNISYLLVSMVTSMRTLRDHFNIVRACTLYTQEGGLQLYPLPTSGYP